MKVQRSFTEDEKATTLAVLAAHAGNLGQTARITGINRRTIRTWSLVPASQKVIAKRRDMVQTLTELSWKILRVARHKMPEASFSALMVGFGISIDKIAVLRAQPPDVGPVGTDEYDYSRLSVAQLEALNALLDLARLGTVGTGPAVVAGVHPMDDAGVQGELAPSGTVCQVGPVDPGGGDAAHGVHATPAREERAGVEAATGDVPGVVPGQGSDSHELRGEPSEPDEPRLPANHRYDRLPAAIPPDNPERKWYDPTTGQVNSD